jgi:hypothetical protein
MNENPYSPPHAPLADQSGKDLSAAIVMTFDQLTRADRWRFFWGYVWRGLVMAVVSSVGGGVAGAFIGAILGGAGAALHKPASDVLFTIRIVVLPVAIAIGLVVLWQFIRWLFRTDWFGYRLRLVRNST